MNAPKSASLVSACALMVTALFPATLSAQSANTSPVPRYHLVQLSVETASVSVEDFEAKTKAIETCAQAVDLGRSLGADIKRNRFVRATAMPNQLQDILEDLEVGQATPVFSADESMMRVLVLCGRP